MKILVDYPVTQFVGKDDIQIFTEKDKLKVGEEFVWKNEAYKVQSVDGGHVLAVPLEKEEEVTKEVLVEPQAETIKEKPSSIPAPPPPDKEVTLTKESAKKINEAAKKHEFSYDTVDEAFFLVKWMIDRFQEGNPSREKALAITRLQESMFWWKEATK